MPIIELIQIVYSKHNALASMHETGETTAKPISSATNKKNNGTIYNLVRASPTLPIMAAVKIRQL